MAQPQPVDGDRSRHGVPRYEVLLGARLGPSWSAWFDGLQVQPTAEGRTLLIAGLPDQATLHGLLARIRDLRIELLSLRCQDDPGRGGGGLQAGD